MYDHLNKETKETVNQTKELRIAHNWKDWWIRYRKADEILQELEKALLRPVSIRPLNELIVSPAGNGKTALLSRFRETHLAIISAAGNGKTALVLEFSGRHPEQTTPDVQIMSVIYVLTPPSPNEGRMLSAILKGLGYPDYDKGTVASRERMVLNALNMCQTRLILVDEVHNMLGGYKRAEEALRVLKNISSSIGIPIVFAGTEDALTVLKYDPQLTTRLNVIEIPLWKNDEEFRRLLFLFEGTLSLMKPSQLWKDPKATKVFELSAAFDSNPDKRRAGILVNILKLIRYAADLAITDGTEQITINHLEQAAAKWGWK